MAENNTVLENTLRKLLEDRKYLSAKDVLSTMNPSDIASVLDELGKDELPKLFRLLPKELAADAFVEMDSDRQQQLIQGFSDTELRQVLDELYVDDAVDIVEEMPANVVRRILEQADPEMRKDINQILRYPEDSAGSVMTTEYISLRSGMSVGEAIEHIRKTGYDKETIYTCYVTDRRKLIGTISVKDLLLAKDDNIEIGELTETHFISVNTHTDQEEVAQIFSRYNLLALPVVDSEGLIVGIITVDDA
ncbi:MAG: magnesium transporter, partial [Spirochaetales bacterium]|nr:magnesium transporter [Spirochaetales bacterium]